MDTGLAMLQRSSCSSTSQYPAFGGAGAALPTGALLDMSNSIRSLESWGQQKINGSIWIKYWWFTSFQTCKKMINIYIYMYIYIWLWFEIRVWIGPRWSGRLERTGFRRVHDPDLAKARLLPQLQIIFLASSVMEPYINQQSAQNEPKLDPKLPNLGPS